MDKARLFNVCGILTV